MFLPILFVVLFVLLGLYIGLLVYYRCGWKALRPFSRNEKADLNQGPFISVVVAARNEEKNIGHLLQSLLNQSYPPHLYEVIVIDDHSIDQTAQCVQSFAGPIRLIALADEPKTNQLVAFKKKAIALGIQKSKGSLIVTTDADCIAPIHWLSTIAAYYQQHKPSFMVMPVRMRHSRRWLDIFQSLDFMSLQGITGASAQLQFHGMCNGANLAYTKAAFEEVDGFKGIDHIASGDDMMLLHKIAARYPNGIAYIQSADVLIETGTEKTLYAFIQQRIRWASKAKQYKDIRLLPVLLLVYVLNALMLLATVAVCIDASMMWAGFSINGLYLLSMAWLIKTLTEGWFLYPVAVFFKQKQLLYWFPWMQPFHILYTLVAGGLGAFVQYRWKDRIVQ